MRKAFLIFVAVFASGVSLAHALIAQFPTSGVYDETATQTNNVDFNGAFNSGTGGATAANTTTASTGNGASYSSAGPFNANLAAAFAVNAGGVWNFDTGPTGNLSSGNALSYGVSQTKSITITETNPQTPMFVSAGGPTHDSTSISLSNYLDNVNGFSYAFSFSNLTGGLPGEGVVQVGFTALSATDPNTGLAINFGTVTAVANFSGGGSVTETGSINALKTLGDTFFGFVAPNGQTITSFSVSSQDNTGSPDLDDIAFITSAVPEPSVGILLVVGATIFAIRKRITARRL